MPHALRRFAVSVAGGLLLATGVVLLVLPGPGFLLIAAGLAVLATEYVWAQRLLNQAKGRAAQVQREAVASPWRVAFTVLFALGMIALGVAEFVAENIPFRSITAGVFLILGGLILLTTTAVSWQHEHGLRTPKRTRIS